MPAFPCPSCGASFDVSASQAGSQTPCPHCGQTVSLPKLGELRRLDATASESGAVTPSFSQAGSLSVSRVAFVACFFVAAIAAILGGFCLIRGWAITVPGSTSDHIAQIETYYPEIPAAQLVREWQQIESFSEELAMPYPYREIAAERSDWLRKGMLGMFVAAVVAGLAAVIGVIGRPNRADA